jgi:glycosyltransferase involved in cell wall biosynthesis
MSTAPKARARMVVGQLIEGDTPGGAERLVIQFAEELERRSHGIVTIIPAGGPAWLGNEMKRLGFPWATIRRRSMFDPRIVSDLVSILREHGATALHSHEFIGVHGARAARALRLPHVITMHGSPFFAEKWRRRMAFRWALRHSALVGVSRDTSTHAEQVLGLAAGTALTIPNGIAPRPGDGPGLRRELGLGPDALVVSAVGNVSERKNHIQLLRALLLVQARHPEIPWQMVVAGQDRGCMAEIRAVAAEHGVSDRVHLLGHRDDTENVLAAADVFAMPSLHEGMPLAIIEAMFASRPVVSSTAGGVADMFDDGREGFLFPVGDTTRLAAALEGLLLDPLRRATMGTAGRARAERQFGIGPMMDAYEALYAGR